MSKQNKGLDKWELGQEWTGTKMKSKAKFKNLKEEVLYNEYCPISQQKWNDVLGKSQDILFPQIGSKERNRFSRLLRSHNISLANIVALKLYTDCDALQRSFKACYLSNCDKKSERVRSFYWWRKHLRSAFNSLSRIPHLLKHQPKLLFQGVRCNSIQIDIRNKRGVYYGPCSTSLDINIARQFAGDNGMIIVIKPNALQSDFKALDLSLISGFPEEREILLFDHFVELETLILSNDYDDHYTFYQKSFGLKCKSIQSKKDKSKLTVNMDGTSSSSLSSSDSPMEGYNSNMSDELLTSKQVALYLKSMKKCSDDSDNSSNVIVIESDCKQQMIGEQSNNKKNKKKKCIDFSDHANNNAMSLLCNLYKFAEDFAFCSKSNSKNYDQLIYEVTRDVDSIRIPVELFSKFINNQRINSNHFKQILSEYLNLN